MENIPSSSYLHCRYMRDNAESPEYAQSSKKSENV